MAGGRRFFVGDLHGCRAELEALLDTFGFRPGRDSLFSVGDVVGRGPDVPGTLKALKDRGAGVVRGNHELSLLQAARHDPGGSKGKGYLDALGDSADAWVAWVETWPFWLDLGDILLVHGGLEPGKGRLEDMDPKILTRIRTWDGQGEHLNRPGQDPPWYACIDMAGLGKTVVFGHWAERGLVDLPHCKGLDTGCVYGGKLTGWCPEEGRFYQVPAERAYAGFGRA